MGILANALAIGLGGLIGCIIKKELSVKKFAIFGVCVAIISLVSFFENVYQVENDYLKGTNLYILVFALILGYFIGELFKLEDKVNAISKFGNQSGFMESAVFFIVGGLQISGPILLGVSGDNSLLFLKSAIDFPFAIMFGATKGKGVIFSSIPVAIIQLIITAIASCFGNFISAQMVAQLCSVGYVILFFSGINMLSDDHSPIKVVNALPAILVIIIINVAISLL